MLPGLLHIRSTITSPTLTPGAYNTWYGTIHIPELRSIPGGPKQARRYKTTDPSRQKWHFLTLYPLDDIAFTRDSSLGEKISFHHPILPEGKSIWELVELEGRDYVLVGDSHGFVEAARWIVIAEMDAKSENEEVVEKRLNEHVSMLDGVKCTRYRIHRAPTAMVGVDSVEVHAPRELLVYGLDNKEDIQRIVRSLREGLDGAQVEIECASWEAI